MTPSVVEVDGHRIKTFMFRQECESSCLGRRIELAGESMNQSSYHGKRPLEGADLSTQHPGLRECPAEDGWIDEYIRHIHVPGRMPRGFMRASSARGTAARNAEFTCDWNVYGHPCPYVATMWRTRSHARSLTRFWSGQKAMLSENRKTRKERQAKHRARLASHVRDFLRSSEGIDFLRSSGSVVYESDWSRHLGERDR
ncbi:hypothetical protein FOZ62_028757 [Perkinsus olseni]|uniref:Uncharacterized protein n=2 Tax=Perkinsus olseni TaxID=32597 RepID=A0A7J6TDC9_PEROL|nr:hypothetical protein FOZ62_028757 [Perkinsus olseni]